VLCTNKLTKVLTIDRHNNAALCYRQVKTLKSIREWAKKNGHDVSDRGRLPAELLQAWQTTPGSNVSVIGSESVVMPGRVSRWLAHGPIGN
jgi:hypothetical protein